MNTLLLAFLALIGYILAYRIYGRYLARKLFNLSDSRLMPSKSFRDDIDFVPTKKHIVFGHHFTTIAGLGPIVGPAIGIIWGWLPAFLWVFLGSIFMGAVHDFTTLVFSARNNGNTIGDLTGNLISNNTRMAFQFIIQLLLFIVLAVFAMIVGVLFVMYPQAVIPIWFQIPIAIWLGWQIRKGKNDLLYSIIGVILLYASIYLGILFPVEIFPINGSPVVTWSIILFIYVYIASTLPVQILLQPRDYINSHQLLVALLLLVLGLIVAHPPVTAPAINPVIKQSGHDLPNLMPLLFITIACGAISGFHSLASSGTTVKQVEKETDTLFVGYGSMLLESFLAVLVILSIAGGLGMGLMDHEGIKHVGVDAFQFHYSSWLAASGLDAKLRAFIEGASNLFVSFGIPKDFGISLVAVFIVSFANTTLDSAARIQRLSLQEICKTSRGKPVKPFHNRYFATIIVVVLAASLTYLKKDAKGALMLWPLFGALNQLLAALGLALVSLYLALKKKNIWYTVIPMLFILFMTLWAMINNLFRFYEKNEWVLVIISLVVLVLTVWLLISGLISIFSRKRKISVN